MPLWHSEQESVAQWTIFSLGWECCLRSLWIAAGCTWFRCKYHVRNISHDFLIGMCGIYGSFSFLETGDALNVGLWTIYGVDMRDSAVCSVLFFCFFTVVLS